MNREIPQLTRDFLYSHQHHLLDGAVGRAVTQAFYAGIVDDFVRQQIQEPVRKHKIAQAFIGPFRRPRLRRGELIQGLDIKRNRIRIALQALCSHSLTLGTTGAGKTTKALFHALQIAKYVPGLWLIDCRKTEWAKIEQLLERLGIPLIVLHVRKLRINPLQVPYKMHPADWIARVGDMLVMVLESPARASKLLQTALHRLYERMGIFEGKMLYPTLFDLLNEVKRDKEANPAARQALVDSVQPLLDSLGPEVLAYRRGWTTRELATKPINFVFGGVPDVAVNLILNTLLFSEITSRIAQGVSNKRMDLYISVDEGQRIASTSRGVHNALAELWPLIRGTGIGLELSIPTAHGLMPEALSFSSTKYIGKCGSVADYEVARAMGCSKEQIDWAFHHTRPGRWICQIGEGEHRYPYVLDIPPMNLPTRVDVSHDDIGGLATLAVVRANEFFRNAAIDVKRADAADVKQTLNDREYRFCKVVAEYPLQRSSSYPSMIRMSSKTAKKLREQLVAKKVLRERLFDSGKRGRSSILLEVTKEGLRALTEFESQQGSKAS